MAKAKKSSKGGIQRDAVTKKAQVANVEDTQVYLTPAELTHVANFIIGFSEIRVPFPGSDGEPYFRIDNVKPVCAGKYTADTVNRLTLEPNVGCPLVSASHVMEYIREGSPTPQVAEVLVKWFDEFYLPRIKRLPDIYKKLCSDTKTWRWLILETDRVGMTVNDWVRLVALGHRDRLVDGIVNRVNKIKCNIGDVLFDDAVGRHNEVDAATKPVLDVSMQVDDPKISADYLIKIGKAMLRNNQTITVNLQSSTDTVPF